jgi:flavin-dependent thymidylate synthase
MRSHLKAPLEMVDLHFFIEGVTRSFTHQMVRQRTAVYVQESLRFAVKGDLAGEVAIPPSLQGLDDDDPLMRTYMDAVNAAEVSYEALIAAGVPAEDARGLLPHATTTRLFYKTNLRNLLDHAGNRLCTQAQFEWRIVFVGIMRAISEYNPPVDLRQTEYVETVLGNTNTFHKRTNWQFELIGQARPETFAPACYQQGKCPFQGNLDRHCKIRERVDANAEAGRAPADWHLSGGFTVRAGEEVKHLYPISPEEWLVDHTSARRQRDAHEEHSHEHDVPCFPACPLWGVSDA